MARGTIREAARPTESRDEYDDHASVMHNRPGPLTLDDYDRADEGLSLRGLRTSARRRHRADELTSPSRPGWRIGGERGVAAVEIVAMAVGVIGLVAILGATAYHVLGCERGGDCVSKYLRLP